jgi:hypothetical protein
MSYSKVRSYLKQQIALENSKLEEHLDAFNVDNIPQTKIDKTYHINFGNISTTHDDNWIEDSMSATITIFKRGFSEPTKALDAIMDTANCIRLRVIDPKALMTDNILSAEILSVTPEPIDGSNDNTIKVSIEFNIRLTYQTLGD